MSLFPKVDHFIAVDAEPTCEYDEYTPLTVTWPSYGRSLDPPITLMYGGSGSYLEIKLLPGSGELTEFVLISAAPNISSAMSRIHYPEAVGPSVPVVAIGEEKDRTLRDVDVHVTAYVDVLYIRLGQNEPHRWQSGHPVGFGLSVADELCAVAVAWGESDRARFVSNA